MTKDQKFSLKNPSILFLSFLGTGFSKIAPGTVGSIATLPLIILFFYIFDFYQYKTQALIIFIIFLILASIVLTEKVQKKWKIHDPQWIVIDETIGMLITWSFLWTINPIWLTLAFILFRIFDIIKIWPASYFDSKVNHGAGTILDDVISGLYAGYLAKLCFSYWPF